MRALAPRVPGGSADRARAAAICLGLVALVFAQNSGQIVGDTKFDLVVDPLRFLGRSLHLWDPSANFGQLQDQAYGYLFPMGPFFALGHAMDIPAWQIQRAWQSVLLIAAFLGMRALAARLGIGTPATRLIGGLLFALSPFILSEIGPLSAEAATECLAPWVLLPLVGEGALLRPRRAAACSGVAVLLAGGVNASATLALLVLPALWLVMRPPGRGRRRLIGWWVVSMLFATLWWALPLLVLGRYSPVFTGWIESASTTTSTTGLFAVLSGTETWVGHLTTPAGPIWQSAWALATNGTAIANEAVVAALGLVGLTRAKLPERRFLVAAAMLGVVILSLGHAGPLSLDLAAPERRLLDHGLNAFRNIQKFDLVLRVPLTLALVYFITEVNSALSARQSRIAGRPLVRPLAGVACIAVIGLGLPLWSHQLEPAGSFEALPTWWPQTASYLGAHDDGSRALLLPASSHGDYAWGLPEDEPLQALATTPWAVRSAVPFGGAGEARLLDGVDQQIESGQGSAGLAPYLARAGVGYLVVRNDLDPSREELVPPAVVAAALQNSPGITKVASFGLTLGDAGNGPVVLADGVSVAVPAVQIYRVAGVTPRISTQSVAGTLRVSGGVESLLPMAAHGLLAPDQATVMAQSPVVPGDDSVNQQRVVTDGNRRAEVNFGRVTNIYSSTLLPGQPWSQPRASHDYESGDPAGHQTTAVVYGATTVRASSSASDAAAFWLFDQADGPVGAFDGDPRTTWVSGGLTAVGQWVEAELYGDPAPTSITLWAPKVDQILDPATEVTVTTDAGTETVPVSATPAVYPLPPGHTSRVRVTVAAVRDGGAGTIASVEATLPGLPPEVGLRVPADSSTTTGGLPSATAPVFAFSALPQDNGCVTLTAPARTVCSPTLVGGSEDELGIDRAFTLDRGQTFQLAMTAVARGGAALDRALPHPVGLRLSVSSRSVDSPAAGADAMVDGSVSTGWRASTSDTRPAITAALTTPRKLVSLRLQTSSSLAASPPQTVTIDSDGGAETESASVGAGGLVTLQHPLLGRRFVVHLATTRPRHNLGVFGITPLPIGVSELQLYFLHGKPSETVAPSSPFSVPCGAGPMLQIDGRFVRTAVSGSFAAVMSGQQLSVRACGATAAGVHLALGDHRIRYLGTGTVMASSLVLIPTTPLPSAGPSRSVRVLSWQADTRRVVVGSGAASWLVMPENANAGWRATLAGHRLTPATLDGWKQAFLLPAGSGGTVTIQYGPDSAYRKSLLAGGVLALLLIGMAVVRERARATRPAARERRRGIVRAAGLLPLLAAPAVAGLDGVLAVGAVVVVAVLAAMITSRWVQVLGAVAAAGVLVAGAVAIRHPFAGAPPRHAFDLAIELLCVVALAAVSVSVVAQSELRSGP